MSIKVFPVIMCGGAGSRLWPRSRQSQPKQFLSLVEDATLFEATLSRVTSRPGDIQIAAPTVICGATHEDMARQQLDRAGWPDGTIIIEPSARNTAAVTAVASVHAAAADPDAVVLLLPADHYVEDFEGFWHAIRSGLPAVQQGSIVTLGIQPTGPETGYGYIQKAASIGPSVYAVEQFKEKPDAETAAAYLKSGDFFWNAGIFLFRADVMTDALETYAPDILTHSRAAYNGAAVTGRVHFLNADHFSRAPSEPIDIAVMEKADRVAVVAPVDIGWSDVGSWSVIADLKTAASNDPAGATKGDVIALDCEGSLIETDGPTVAAIGLKDMVVIVDGGSILIMPKDKAQSVKTVVEHLNKTGRTDKL